MAPPRDQAPNRYQKAVPAAAQGRHQSDTTRPTMAIARRTAEIKERQSSYLRRKYQHQCRHTSNNPSFDIHREALFFVFSWNQSLSCVLRLQYFPIQLIWWPATSNCNNAEVQ
jgi:hypothetical protein